MERQKKIYVTKFIHDSTEYVGPDIHAENAEQAQFIAEANGLIIDGELTDLIGVVTENRPRVLH